MTGFNPRVALITGGGSGIGAALAKRLAGTGVRVIVADIDLHKARGVAGELGGHSEAVEVDVSSMSQMEALVERIEAAHGGLDLIVNCAGIAGQGEMLEIPQDGWNRVLDVNLRGTINGSIAAYALMARQGAGYIVNLGSMSTFLRPPLFGPYVTSKAGILGFSLALAVEAEAHGVHVSVICPGNVRTPLLGSWDNSPFTPAISPEEAARRILRGVARKRRIVVFPFYAKVVWWLDRLSPNLLNPLRRLIIRRARRRRQPASRDS